MTKEFSGGLSELFRESSEQKQEQTPTQPTSTAQELSSDEAATPEEEDELINSVDDEELKEALRQRRLRGNGRPKKDSTKQRASDGYTRACIVVNAEKYEKMKNISLMETLPIKDVIEAAMDLAIEAYERTHGAITNFQRGDATKLFK
jgi:hypothetical protein